MSKYGFFGKIPGVASLMRTEEKRKSITEACPKPNALYGLPSSSPRDIIRPETGNTKGGPTPLLASNTTIGEEKLVPSQDSPRLEWARFYLKMGLSVIPLAEKSKIPIAPWAEFQNRLATEKEILQWFGNGSKLNIGIVTGQLSGLAVVDLDSEQAIAFARKQGMPPTPLVKTARGYHAYYLHQDGVRNFQKAPHLPDIDLRGEGGYVVVPPSIHETGHRYQWVNDQGIGKVPSANLPPWVSVANPKDKHHLKELEHGVKAGGRNNALTRLVGSWVNGDGTLEEVLEKAREVNTRNTPPLPDGEIKAIVKSIYGRHYKKAGDSSQTTTPPSQENWPKPEPLPDGLQSVKPFNPALLPDALRPWIEDIADRIQCPIDFPAVAVMIGLAGLVGRQIGIRPKRRDGWLVVPNLWGVVIGRPGVLKTPALQEPLRPLRTMEATAAQKHKAAVLESRAKQLVEKEGSKVAADRIRKALKDGNEALGIAREVVESENTAPVRERYLVNDTTVEKLGELLNENPRGLLIFRDELAGFLRSMDREGHEGARAFYLEAWNGTGTYTYDRIGRGTIDIEAACVSILGGIQPGPLAEYVRRTVRGGVGDDGLLQRFQLAVFPDVTTNWKNIDRWPDSKAKARAIEVFERLNKLDAPISGALQDDEAEIPFLRFDDEAQEAFDKWRTALEQQLRTNKETPIMEAHLAKYRSLVPSLALLIHLCDETTGTAVSRSAMERAAEWAVYLESHARRIYAPAISPDMASAQALADRIRQGSLPDRFTLREVYRPQWSGLTTREDAKTGIEILIDFNWLIAEEGKTGRRKKTFYVVNPRAKQI